MNIISSSKSRDGMVKRAAAIARERAHALAARRAKAEHSAAVKTHAEASKTDRSRNGWTGKHFRRIGQVPASVLRDFRSKNGPQDGKALKKFLKNKGYNTVSGTSF